MIFNRNIINIIKIGSSIVASRLVPQAAQIALIPWFLKIYGSEYFGLISTLATINAAASIFSFGITKDMMNVLASKVGKGEVYRETVITTLESIKTIIVFVAILFFISCWAYFSNYNLTLNYQKELILIFGMNFLILFFNGFINDVLRGLQEQQSAAKISMYVGCTTVCMSILSLVSHVNILTYFILVYTAPSIINAILFLRVERIKELQLGEYLKKTWNMFEKIKLTANAKLFFMLTLIQFVNFSSDTLIISNVLGFEEAAIYNLVFKLHMVVIMVFSSFSGVVWPILRRMNSSREDTVGIYFFGEIMLGFCSILTFFAMFFWGETFYTTIMKVDMVFPKTIFSLMAIQTITVLFTSYLIPIMNAHEKLKIQVILGTVSMFVNLLLTFTLTNYIGVEGAIIATIIAHGVFVVIPLTWVYIREVRPSA